MRHKGHPIRELWWHFRSPIGYNLRPVLQNATEGRETLRNCNTDAAVRAADVDDGSGAQGSPRVAVEKVRGLVSFAAVEQAHRSCEALSSGGVLCELGEDGVLGVVR